MTNVEGIPHAGTRAGLVVDRPESGRDTAGIARSRQIDDTPTTMRWAIERDGDRRVIGGAVLFPLPPGDDDLEIGGHLTLDASGHGCEATFTLASWAAARGRRAVHDRPSGHH